MVKADVPVLHLNGVAHNFFYAFQPVCSSHFGAPMNTAEKTQALKEIIALKGSMLISFSGGVDSSLLAVLAKDALAENTRCVLLDSPVVPRLVIADARKIAEEYGLLLEIIPVRIMDDERFVKNPSDRCYWCRKKSAKVLKWRKDALHYACIADGINVSDTGEHRPGLAASTEEGIIHPFLEAGITKEEIRTIAKESGLQFWNKPTDACLASRIPYGDEITREKLGGVEKAEDYLHTCGFPQCRVRMHGNIARIEIVKEDMQKLLSNREDLVKTLRSIGFTYISLDLAGYRSGSMDEVL